VLCKDDQNTLLAAGEQRMPRNRHMFPRFFEIR